MSGIFFWRKQKEGNAKCLLKSPTWREICDALLDLVPFVPLRKRGKHALRSVTFSKVAD